MQPSWAIKYLRAAKYKSKDAIKALAERAKSDPLKGNDLLDQIEKEMKD